MDLALICRAAVRAGASDVHLKVGLPPLVRIDGRMVPIPKAPPLTSDLVERMLREVVSGDRLERFRAHPDLDCAYVVEGLGRFRVNVFRARGQVGMVLRAIPDKVATIDELGLPGVLKRIALEPRGLVLVTGVTGSGKSTTLAALVEEINQNLRHHVVTIEDPIEFTFRDRRSIINQREIGTDSASFHVALRAALRQDPDAILIGELRDRETTEIALSAAETGHLVFSTLHTLNASEAINRLVDFFDPHHQQQVRNVLSGSLVAIVSQRLVPRVGGGRLAALEILLNRGAVTQCLTDPTRLKEIPDHLARGTAQYGSQVFDQSLFWAFQDGAITREDAIRYANNAEDLSLRLSGIASEEWVRPA